MSKVVTAINVMISNPDRITNVVKGCNDSECFFVYDDKHLWSILKRDDGGYYLAYYPGNQNATELAKIPDEYWHNADINYVAYTSGELGTKEARESMAELFMMINEKVYGMDDVLDDIINSDIPF